MKIVTRGLVGTFVALRLFSAGLDQVSMSDVAMKFAYGKDKGLFQPTSSSRPS